MKIWTLVCENSNAIIAIATSIATLISVIMFYQTMRSARATAETFCIAAELWKTSQRPIVRVERMGRTDDGQNYNHEDLIVRNEGAAPRFFTHVTVREYLCLHFSQLRGPVWMKEFLLPVMFYSYGTVYQNLTGDIYKKIGDNARKKHFDFDKEMRDFAKSKGAGYYSSLEVVIAVGYVDVFGEHREEFFDADGSMGQRVRTKEDFEKYPDRLAQCLLYPVEQFEMSKIAPEKIWEHWVVPDHPEKITKEDLSKAP